MPYYIRTMDKVQFGVLTQIYGYIAILLVVLTYGFETSFFRFAKSTTYSKVFTTAITSIVSTSSLFVLVVALFKDNLADVFSQGFSAQLLLMMALIVGVDAISSIIFAKLRYEGKSVRFGLLKLLNVIVLIGLNIYFLKYVASQEGSNFIVDFVGLPISDNQALYVLISNFVASFVVLIFILSDAYSNFKGFDFRLLLQMFKYSYPILIVGITGMVNIQIDKILIPKIIGGDEGLRQLAIYGANFKIGVLMAMFTQSFRMAFEPFFFKDHSETKNESIYSGILKIFMLFGFLIFLGVTFYMDIINLVLTDDYKVGNVVIPIVLLSQLLSGMYFTLSVWYKVTDKTLYGAYMGIVGSVITVSLNLILIPMYGYVGAAIAGLVCFLVMVLLSVYWGNKNSNIKYDWNQILRYTVLVGGIYGVGIYMVPYLNSFVSIEESTLFNILNFAMRTALIIVFLAIVYIKEFKKSNFKI